MRTRTTAVPTAVAVLVAALVTVLSPSAARAAPAPGCTAIDIGGHADSAYRGPAMSADGLHAAYISDSDLWVIDFATHTRTRLVNLGVGGQTIRQLAVDGDGTTFA